MRNTSVVIHLDHFLNNIEQIRNVIGPHVKISASVKADAYGHGAVALARAAERAGIDFLGIACPEEGVELREAGIRIPLLLYGLCLPGEIDRLIDLDISAVVADSEGIDLFARSAARLKKKARLHLKIDTGMGRIGCNGGGSPPGESPLLHTLNWKGLPPISLSRMRRIVHLRNSKSTYSRKL
jgi:alanine racemase